MGKNYYVKGVGLIGDFAIKFPYKRFLEADSITEKQVVKFKKVWGHLDMCENKIKFQKSVVEKILRKSNVSSGLPFLDV